MIKRTVNLHTTLCRKNFATFQLPKYVATSLIKLKSFAENLMVFPAVKESGKSLKLSRCYHHEISNLLFWNMAFM